MPAGIYRRARRNAKGGQVHVDANYTKRSVGWCSCEINTGVEQRLRSETLGKSWQTARLVRSLVRSSSLPFAGDGGARPHAKIERKEAAAVRVSLIGVGVILEDTSLVRIRIRVIASLCRRVHPAKHRLASLLLVDVTRPRVTRGIKWNDPRLGFNSNFLAKREL